MERPVEVAVMERGRLEAVRTLSPRRERLAGVVAGGIGAGSVLAGMSVTMAWVSTAELVVHAPTFFGFWGLAAASVATLCARWSKRRCERYRVGADIEADAFAPSELDLVKRSGDDYDLGLVPGMVGTLDTGRAPMPIEALTAYGAVRVPLPREGRVQIELGGTTFVIGRRGADEVRLGAFARRLARLSQAGVRRLVRTAGCGVATAAAASALLAVPAVPGVTHVDVVRALTPSVPSLSGRAERFLTERIAERFELQGWTRGLFSGQDAAAMTTTAHAAVRTKVWTAPAAARVVYMPAERVEGGR